MTGNVFRVDQECVEGYLFVRRPLRVLLFRRGPSRGRIWVPVSGKVEPADRNLSRALLREIEEETGFKDPRRVSPLQWVYRFRGPRGGRWRLHAFAVEFRRRSSPQLSDEHESFEWLDPAVALARLHYRDNRTALRRLLRGVARRERRRHLRNA